MKKPYKKLKKYQITNNAILQVVIKATIESK